ncbi:ATP-dependent helicase [Lignipirellula cremea]|uniref:DNA 3'-5' helicase n=1 Tax=Lignipirellula cremea TaxID=2528010 RepID=A0A518DWZ2_9BACT|nr:UvrD-helicase domain-containing protein [Lignipirellula cremea]QDU96358.1 ATP-dependent DNA helicase PcrA [Lignipirellula cremea]
MSHDLNPAQRQAVETLSGPLLVLAGAGTGKTRVVTYRIAALIRSGIAPERILAVTFTNKAAAEMQERVAKLLGKRKEKPKVSTFHSHCVFILRQHISKLGYPAKFAIYDGGDQESLARTVLREIRVSNEMMRPGDLLRKISNWKSAAIRPAEAASLAETDKEHLAAMGYRRYQKALKLSGAVDFDDLLLLTEDLFREHADVREKEAGRFDHLLVDEYQDTNGTQYRIVKALAKDHRNLCVVGDDDQSIYGWRGAEVEHILKFARDWSDAVEVRLEENYRSTAEILNAANTLIAYNKKRHDKILRPARAGGEKPRINQHKDETEEAKAVVADIQRLLTDPHWSARDVAVLFRTNEQPRPFETEMRRVKIPYVVVGGMSFFDRKEVRDILAYLRLLVMQQDEVSLLRIMNTPARGIGQGSVENLMKTAVSQAKTIWEIISNPGLKPQLPAAADKGVNDLVGLIRHFGKLAETSSLVDTARGLIAKIRYEDEIRRRHPEPNDQESRIAAVEEVVNAIGAYESRSKKPTLAGFLEETALGGREFDNEKDKQLRRNAVVLMTLHAAKGLEFPHVYMVGMEEGILPHHRAVKLEMESDAIDEERRLCYVGVTRAQDRLTLSMARTRMKWGKPRETTPSRFLYEIIGKADNAHRIAARSSGSRPTGRGAARKRPPG